MSTEEKKKADQIPEQQRTCASHQVGHKPGGQHTTKKHPKHKSQALGISATSFQGNVYGTPTLPWWNFRDIARISVLAPSKPNTRSPR